MGVTWSEFWGMNPHIIKCIAKGHLQKQKDKDELMHLWWGNYGLSAVSVAVEHCLAGRKAKSSYIDKPLMANIGEKIKAPLTEEEKRKQTENLFIRLQIMGANFKNNHKDGTES